MEHTRVGDVAIIVHVYYLSALSPSLFDPHLFYCVEDTIGRQYFMDLQYRDTYRRGDLALSHKDRGVYQVTDGGAILTQLWSPVLSGQESDPENPNVS